MLSLGDTRKEFGSYSTPPLSSPPWESSALTLHVEASLFLITHARYRGRACVPQTAHPLILPRAMVRFGSVRFKSIRFDVV